VEGGDVTKIANMTAAETLAAAAQILDDADRDANPVGTTRTIAGPRDMGTFSVWANALSIDTLPGLWLVRRTWEEAGVWMHEIERIR
jgi:hypothetical protein